MEKNENLTCLRPIQASDTASIVKWRNNPRVRRNFIDQTLLTEEMHQGWMEKQVCTGRVSQFIIVSREDNKDVGTTFLRDVDKQNKRAEFGILIGEDAYCGLGLGHSATVQIVQYGFEVLGLNRIFLRVLSENTAARQIYFKAGFQEEGTFRQHVCLDGQFKDVTFMAILQKDEGCQ